MKMDVHDAVKNSAAVWRRVAERLEAEVARLTAALAAEESRSGRLAEALKPFAVVFQQMANNGKEDDRSVWGYNDAMLKRGDFRRAFDTISTLKGSTDDAQA